MLRPLPLLLLGVILGSAAPAAAATPSPPATFQRVVVEPTRTSIYVGSVGLQMPPFIRENGGFVSTYTARVRPYFFASERGTLRIMLSADDLQRLAAGERVEFTGEAHNEEGERREITGHATPADAHSGRLKVRVRVSSRIELIFNTTYRFEDAPGPR